ncbi:MAG TPA: hypothetical protein PLI62_14205 [Spirochaetota bacterium]|nr:hypothetical protein [Spirochaetota bacterium]HQO03414.1 hypothetical protein [Spirochaetota bacterium]
MNGYHQEARNLYIKMCYDWQYREGKPSFADFTRLHELYEKALMKNINQEEANVEG